MEKWTAADEKLWAELEKRRETVLGERRRTLIEALKIPYVPNLEISFIADYLEANAQQIIAALEPYVLHPEVSNE